MSCLEYTVALGLIRITFTRTRSNCMGVFSTRVEPNCKLYPRDVAITAPVSLPLTTTPALSLEVSVEVSLARLSSLLLVSGFSQQRWNLAEMQGSLWPR